MRDVHICVRTTFESQLWCLLRRPLTGAQRSPRRHLRTLQAFRTLSCLGSRADYHTHTVWSLQRARRPALPECQPHHKGTDEATVASLVDRAVAVVWAVALVARFTIPPIWPFDPASRVLAFVELRSYAQPRPCATSNYMIARAMTPCHWRREAIIVGRRYRNLPPYDRRSHSLRNHFKKQLAV